jgi:serine/threonine protein kinase
MSAWTDSVDPPSGMSEAPAIGDTLGPWVIQGRLDGGSYGVVYRAQRAGHPALGDFALKLARGPKDPRFEREAELLRRCPHPNIPKYEDEGLWTAPSGSRYPYLVMEWIEGLPLYDWARERVSTSREVLQVVAQLAAALAQAHAAGCVHRDVNVRQRLFRGGCRGSGGGNQ